MQLTERHIIIRNKAIEDACFKSARLYNFCNYYRRQAHFSKIEKFDEYELSTLLGRHDQEDFRALPTTVSQQVIRQLFSDWSAFFKSNKAYRIDPLKYKGAPKPPKFKHKDGLNMCVFTKNSFKLKNGLIHFAKKLNIEPIKTNVTSADQVRIIPQATCFVVEVIYTVEETDKNLNKNNFLSLDLGLSNLVTSVNNVGLRPFIINGKVLKSVNQMYNKTKARLMSYVGNRGTSNRIKQNTRYRNNFIEDKLHKISRFIVNYCVENNIGTIVIGKNSGWKHRINIGTINNQKFSCIPYLKIINKITYKCKLVGIEVKLHEESYTSKIDHLALEPLKKQKTYLGKRKFRGLFQSSIGKLINADVNGAIGIARKVFGDFVVKPITDSGLAFNPIRINLV